MALKATTRAAVDQAWAAADDFVMAGTYRHKTGEAEDPVTGTVTPTFADYPVTVIEVQFSTNERALPEVQWTDRKFMIREKEVSGLDLQPSGDLVVIGSVTLNVSQAESIQGLVWSIRASAP